MSIESFGTVPGSWDPALGFIVRAFFARLGRTPTRAIFGARPEPFQRVPNAPTPIIARMRHPFVSPL